MSQLVEISPTEFLRQWPRDEATAITILDVREPAEIAQASLAGTVNIPMNEIPERFSELDQQQPIVVMCHGGLRSRQVAAYLISRGFENVFNLAGGIDAWSTEIDPGVPRY